MLRILLTIFLYPFLAPGMAFLAFLLNSCPGCCYLFLCDAKFLSNIHHKINQIRALLFVHLLVYWWTEKIAMLIICAIQKRFHLINTKASELPQKQSNITYFLISRKAMCIIQFVLSLFTRL